ncbi:MAG: GNAT family N-acetyltransferase [Clostridia bacterium]|nr:GNAT family N-acetyltransferase [Clostridia bacterium]
MKIYEVADKKKYLPLLLLADEQESMVDRYIGFSNMFVIDDNGIKGEIAVCGLPNGVLEIKNLAVFPEFQKQGYGKKLIDFVCEKYKNDFSVIQVGTGDSGLTVPFYEKCGFEKFKVVENFFTDNYDHPIIENGKRLIDMIYLKKEL